MIQLLVLTYNDEEREFNLNSISNSKLSESDYENYMEEREHYGMPIMTKLVRFYKEKNDGCRNVKRNQKK